MKLLIETSNDTQFIKEESGKVYKIKGIFLQGGIKNRNGRIYPIEILEKAVAHYDKKFIQKNRAVGELNHPNSPTINYDRVSHIITLLKKDGNNFIGEAKIIDSPMGKIVKTLLNEGINLGVSSRALGSVKRNTLGINEVQGDLIFSTAADIVHDPSAPDAFVESVMENTEWILGADGRWHEKNKILIDETKDRLVKEKDNREKVFLEQFKKFISTIKV
jgi:hypothetical protein